MLIGRKRSLANLRSLYVVFFELNPARVSRSQGWETELAVDAALGADSAASSRRR